MRITSQTKLPSPAAKCLQESRFASGNSQKYSHLIELAHALGTSDYTYIHGKRHVHYPYPGSIAGAKQHYATLLPYGSRSLALVIPCVGCM